jgi:polyisoprenoid-binding protein YceI
MTTWNIDASHSNAHFSVRHMMITNVHGEFQKLSGTVEYDAERPEATKVTASIDASTINTREEKRDAHLKSADFLDVEKYPTIEFVSKSAKATSDGLELKGDLTIHGTTREVTLAVEGPTSAQKDPWGNTRIGAVATTKIKRSEFNMVWNVALEAGGILVGEDVKITLDVSLIKAA